MARTITLILIFTVLLWLQISNDRVFCHHFSCPDGDTYSVFLHHYTKAPTITITTIVNIVYTILCCYWLFFLKKELWAPVLLMFVLCTHPSCSKMAITTIFILELCSLCHISSVFYCNQFSSNLLTIYCMTFIFFLLFF